MGVRAPWWPFDGLEPHGYDVIMADPPWTVAMRSPKGERKSAQAQYRTLSIDEIAAFPVHLLAADHCALFLWGVWPLVLDARDPTRSPLGVVMQAWGFRYSTGGCWLKRKSRGGVAFGPGYRFRSATEPWLLGVKGAPQNSRAERNLIDGLAREHSRKPEEAYAMLERWMPGARRLELFARTSRSGWAAWGDETGKFDPETAEAEAAA